MEQDPNRVLEAFEKDTDCKSNRSSFCRPSSSLSLSRKGSRNSRRSNSSRRSRDVCELLHSISFSRELGGQFLGDVDSSLIAQVGDIGDRVMINDKEDESENPQFFMDDLRTAENGFQSVSPVAERMKSPLPTDAMIHSTEKSVMQNGQNPPGDEQYKLPRSLDHIFYLIHLGLFGILGALTRYLLQKLFGPTGLALTSNSTLVYLDLPSNMLGSFLMGWFGVVFKADINVISPHLAVGLSTGYLGSLTTFSGWNQKMLNLASEGHWVFAVGGFILGMFLVNESIRIGVESAKGLHTRLSRKLEQSSIWKIDSFKRHILVMMIVLLLLCSLWGLSAALAGHKLDDATNGAVLWLGCLVGPPGVWGRWYLARLNGQGFGKKGLLKWLPLGTLTANILAACLMAALSTISKAVNTKRCTLIVNGVQFGFLGCLSTVSTYVAEVYAMRKCGHGWRAVSYILATILPSFALGTLIYSVPVWTKHYE